MATNLDPETTEMNRLLASVSADTCPHCLGRELAEQIARNEARHPLEAMFGVLMIVPPPEFGFIGGQMFVGGVYERLHEIDRIRKTCN